MSINCGKLIFGRPPFFITAFDCWQMPSLHFYFPISAYKSAAYHIKHSLDVGNSITNFWGLSFQLLLLLLLLFVVVVVVMMFALAFSIKGWFFLFSAIALSRSCRCFYFTSCCILEIVTFSCYFLEKQEIGNGFTRCDSSMDTSPWSHNLASRHCSCSATIDSQSSICGMCLIISIDDWYVITPIVKASLLFSI